MKFAIAPDADHSAITIEMATAQPRPPLELISPICSLRKRSVWSQEHWRACLRSVRLISSGFGDEAIDRDHRDQRGHDREKAEERDASRLHGQVVRLHSGQDRFRPVSTDVGESFPHSVPGMFNRAAAIDSASA